MLNVNLHIIIRSQLIILNNVKIKIQKTDTTLNDNINSWEYFRQRCLDKLNEKEEPNKKDMLEEFLNTVIS